jgi:Bacteriocin-protection, YdeI or OmpD-Associated/Domain of unknown function (DUF1905)
MTVRDFRAVVERRPQGGVALKVPFDPAAAWGERDRYDVTGSVEGQKVRGKLVSRDGAHYLELGPAWCRNDVLREGQIASVSLQPEGPQLVAMDDDIASALGTAPDALRFFESLPTFYRKNYMRWVLGAKRPETRARRVAEMVELLSAGKRER